MRRAGVPTERLANVAVATMIFLKASSWMQVCYLRISSAVERGGVTASRLSSGTAIRDVQKLVMGN